MTDTEILSALLQGSGLGAGGVAAIWFLKTKVDSLAERIKEFQVKLDADRDDMGRRFSKKPDAPMAFHAIGSGNMVSKECLDDVKEDFQDDISDIKNDIKDIQSKISSDKDDIHKELANIKGALGEIKGSLAVLANHAIKK